MAARQPPVDSQVQCLPFRLGDLGCEWIVAPGADPSVRLLYLHGGGYVSGSGAHYAALAALISAAAQCAVLLLDYRLAPEHPFPAGLEDTLQAFTWMQSHGPDRESPATATYIAGDSAGGGLTLAALLALRDRRLPLPTAGIALSAFADLNLSSESIQSQAHTDPIMSPGCLPTFVDLYLAGSDPCDPLASPVLADYTGIPPLLLQVGDFEVIRDDSVRVAARAQEHGVQVQLEVWADMVHVFQVRELPESQEAIDNIAEFMRSHR
jgi:monoterpene epsilon-lactone hydrolase